MSTENKVVDINIEDNLAYGLVLQFQDITTERNIETRTPINLSGITIRASIGKELGGPALLNFSAAKPNPEQGIALLSLTKEQVATLSSNASSMEDRYNPRLRFLGYYDVILISQDSEFRVMEGKVFISKGVTV